MFSLSNGAYLFPVDQEGPRSTSILGLGEKKRTFSLSDEICLFFVDREGPRSTFFAQGEAHGRQKTLSPFHSWPGTPASGCACEWFFRWSQSHIRGLFLLSGDVYRDKSVVWRFWSKYCDPEYQSFSVDRLEPGIYFSSQRPERYAGMEWHVCSVWPECDGDEREL